MKTKTQKKKSSNNYFTQDTEDAIIEYNNCEDPKLRSKIYERRIHYPFFKLTENIIHTYKFYHTEVDELEHLQHEVITFLLSKIHKFDPSKGAKAYSYFGTIAKRYLILSNQKIYKKKVEKTQVDEVDKYDKFSYTIDNSPNGGDPKYPEKLSYYMDEFIDYHTHYLYEIFPNLEDAQIADAILEIFRQRENINIFNKKALYIFIREMVDVQTPKITKVARIMYDEIFYPNYIFYLNNGYIDFPKKRYL